MAEVGSQSLAQGCSQLREHLVDGVTWWGCVRGSLRLAVLEALAS